MATILCIAPGGLGDQIISLPAVRYLRSVFPSHEIEFRIAGWGKRRGLFRLLLGARSPVRSLDALCQPPKRGTSLRNYDWILDFDTTDAEFLTNSAASLNAREKFFSFAKTQRFQNQVRWERDDSFHSPFWQRCFDMAFGVSCDICGTKYSRERMLACADRYRTLSLPRPSARMRQRLRRLLAPGKRAQPRLAVTPGGFNPKHKLWPTDRFEEVVWHAVCRGAAVCVLGSAEESHLGRRLRDLLRARPNTRAEEGGGSVRFLTGQLTLAEVPYVLQEMDLHLSNDNGVAHIGGLLNRPQLVLYRGAQSTHRSVGLRDVALFSGNRSDMTPIATATVVAQLDKLLGFARSKTKRPAMNSEM